MFNIVTERKYSIKKFLKYKLSIETSVKKFQNGHSWNNNTGMKINNIAE